MTSSRILVILDNDLIADGRVNKELRILEENKLEYRVLCYDFGKKYVANSRVVRISNGKFLKNKLQAIVNTFPIITRIWKKAIQKQIADFKPTHIHVHDLYMAPPVYAAIKNRTDIKVVLDLHENYPYAIHTYTYTQTWKGKLLVRPSLWEKKEKRLLEQADSIVVLSEHFAEDLKAKYSTLAEKRFVAFPNYPDYKVLDHKLPIKEEINYKGFKLLYFGIIGKRRGITLTIESINKLRKKGIDIRLILIGPVDKDYTQEFDLLEKEGVQHIKWASLGEFSSYMDECDMAIAPFEVNPQIESGIANKVFQYLYAGLPIIVSNAKPMADLVRDNNCGYVYYEDSELADVIEQAINDKATLKTMSANALKTIKTKYPHEKFSKQLISAYKS